MSVSQSLTALRQTAQDMELALGDLTSYKLAQYLELLQKWNRVYNLTALRNPDQMLSHHLYDSLALLPALRRERSQGCLRLVAESGLRVLDVGSGAGLPGVVIAACEPSAQVTCVDAVAKKTAFVRQVAMQLQLPNLHGVHARVEQLPEDKAHTEYGLITARAFASLEKLVKLSQHRLASGGVWVAMKGHEPLGEIAELPPDVEVFHVEPLIVPTLKAERCLVWMRRKKP